MKTFSKIKFWSLLFFGIIFLIIGIYLLASGNEYPGIIKSLIIAGSGQLVIFYALLFYLYKGKLKEAMKK